MDTGTSNYCWHAKVFAICFAKKIKYISFSTLNVAFYKLPKIVEAEQVDNIIKNANKSFLKIKIYPMKQ